VGKALSLGLEDEEEEQKAPSFAELKEKFLGGKSATLEAAKDATRTATSRPRTARRWWCWSAPASPPVSWRSRARRWPR
jgi:hypothetical protein